VEFLHHFFTDLELLISLSAFPGNRVRYGWRSFDDIDADRPLLGLLQTIEDLGTIEGLSPPIFLMTEGKASSALSLVVIASGSRALPPSPDRLLVLAAGIDDFALRMITERTFPCFECGRWIAVRFYLPASDLRLC
jgi:hypothetical protein